MKIEILLNKSHSQEDIIFNLMISSEEIYLASAFIDAYSITVIKKVLNISRKIRPEIKFLTGLYGGFNRKRHLEELKSISKKYRSKFKFKISEKENFHWKLFGFKTKARYTFIIGSANFTKNGLSSIGEMLLRITDNNYSGIVKKLHQTFKDEFVNAIDVNNADLNKYHERKIEINKGNNKLLSKFLKGVKLKSFLITNDSSKFFCRCIKFQGNCSSTTLKKVHESKSDWAKKDYDFYCFSTKSSFDKALKAVYILNVYREGDKYFLDLDQIIDHDEIDTKDGKYFIAYKPKIRRIWITKIISDKLDYIGINYKKRETNWKERYLNKEQEIGIKEIFNINK